MLARFLLAATMAALPLGALAEGTLNAEEFEAHVTGKTLTYDYGAGVLGIEQYLPGRKVRWAFEGDICVNGIWYQQEDQICFVYENDGVAQCWEFYKEGDVISGTYMGDAAGTFIMEISKTPNPLSCAGPEVGV
jgi:hypothetical protein